MIWYSRNMKLYLSSYKLGDHNAELLNLLEGKKRVAVIMAAQDYKSPEARKERLADECTIFQQMNLLVEELDLRSYFKSHEGLAERLEQYDLLWVRGGNAFVLRKALAMSGADKILPDLIRDEKIIYGGYSAGICVLAPSLHGLEYVDVEKIYVPDYQSETIWDGLGLLPYSIAPHYRSDHYESDAIEDVVEYFETHKMPYKTLRDGEALLIDGDKETLLHR